MKVKTRPSKSNGNEGITSSSFSHTGSPTNGISYNEAKCENDRSNAIAEYKTANDYANAVRQWMWQYQMWNQMNWLYMTMPMYAACMPGSWPGQQIPPGVSMPGISTPGSGMPGSVHEPPLRQAAPHRQISRRQGQRMRG